MKTCKRCLREFVPYYSDDGWCHHCSAARTTHGQHLDSGTTVEGHLPVDSAEVAAPAQEGDSPKELDFND